MSSRGPAARWLRAVSALCLLSGLGFGGWLGWFYWNSARGGHHLLVQALHRVEHPVRPAPASLGGSERSEVTRCAPPTGAVAELVVPSISLVAPVVQGDGDAQLATAVGHVPASAWPGGSGSAVLVAHDVTWFHELDQLKPGAEIEYLSGCRALTYRVTSVRVVHQGAPVANTPATLDLVTCWPLDALWFTGHRLLLTAHEAGGAAIAPAVRVPSAPIPPPLAVPPALQGVDSLAANPTPLGPLHEVGALAPTYTEGAGPLVDATAAQSVFFAATRAAEAASAEEWSAIAPEVPLVSAGPLEDAEISGFGKSLATILTVEGDELVGAQLSEQVVVSGGSHPEEWLLSVSEGLVKGRLSVTGWAMSPV